MHIIFLIKNFQPAKCGLSDYVRVLIESLNKKRIKNTLLYSNSIKSSHNSVFVDWKILNIIKSIIAIREKKIFFFQYSPFLQSKSGFSLKLIIIFFLLKIFRNDCKILLNLHETINKFSIFPKYFLMYILQRIQLTLLIFLSDKIYYTNKKFNKRFPFLQHNKKIQFKNIFSNIKNITKSKIKKNNLTFYTSHYNLSYFNFFFNIIRNYNSNHSKKINLQFLGNGNNSTIKMINRLLKKYNLLHISHLYTNLKEKKFSSLLNSSKITVVTRKSFFEMNSGFHQASVEHNHFLFQYDNSINKNIFFKITNQKTFNYSINKIYNFKGKNIPKYDLCKNRKKIIDELVFDFSKLLQNLQS